MAHRVFGSSLQHWFQSQKALYVPHHSQLLGAPVEGELCLCCAVLHLGGTGFDRGELLCAWLQIAVEWTSGSSWVLMPTCLWPELCCSDPPLESVPDSWSNWCLGNWSDLVCGSWRVKVQMRFRIPGKCVLVLWGTLWLWIQGRCLDHPFSTLRVCFCACATLHRGYTCWEHYTSQKVCMHNLGGTKTGAVSGFHSSLRGLKTCRCQQSDA